MYLSLPLDKARTRKSFFIRMQAFAGRLLLLAALFASQQVIGQTVLDDYSTNTLGSYSTSGVWNIENQRLRCITNGLSTPEHSYASQDLTTYTGLSAWTLDGTHRNTWCGYMRSTQATSSWSTTNYNHCFVLAANAANLSSTSTQGYAIGFNASALQIIRFANGVTDANATLGTTVVAVPYTYNIPDSGISFWVKRYQDGKWIARFKKGKLTMVTDYGDSTKFTDGTSALSAADNTYTGASYKYGGWVWAHNTTTSARFYADNLGAGFQNYSAPVVPSLTADFSGLTATLATPSLPSDRQPIVITASNVNQPVTVTSSSTSFEFSTAATGNTFSASLNLGTSFGSQTVYVRQKATAAGATPSTVITVASATTPTPPASAVSPTLQGGSYATGTQAPFQTNGSTIVIAQLGDATYPQVISGTTYSSPMFLLELNKTTGAVVQRFPLPYVLPSANNGNAPTPGTFPLTVAGTTTTSAQLNLSPDKQHLTFTGYTAPLGILNTVARVSSSYPKVIAELDYQANIDLSTTINDAYEADNLRSAVTTDGSKLWTAGSSSSTQGIRYTTVGTQNSSTGVTTALVPNVRYVNITNSQLYVSSASASNGNFNGINKVGSGLPTSAAAYSNIIPFASPGLADPLGFVFADRSGSVVGNDVIYVADNTNGVVKYYNNGTTWVYAGTIGGNCQGIYAEDKGAAGVDLYVSWCNLPNPSAGGTISRLYKITDNSAQSALIDNNGVALSTAGTLLYTAPGTAFVRGVSAAPIYVPTPSIDAVAAAYTPGSTLPQGTTDQPVYSIQLKVTTATATLNTLKLTTTGTYTSTDVTSFQLYASDDNILDGTDTPFGGSVASTSTGTGETLTFTPSQAFAVGNNNYIFLTATTSSCATTGKTLKVSALSSVSTNLVFNAGTPTTTTAPTAGTTYSVTTGGAPANVSALTPTVGGPTIPFNWTNPSPFCPGFKIIAVAYTTPAVGAPNPATDYTATANANYTLAPAAVGNGKVVYYGTGTGFTLTGLTIGQTYYVKVFVNNSGTLSSGVVASAMAQYRVLYSRSSGTVASATTGTATWSTTPTGTGLPIGDPSNGGLATTTSLVVQNGHTITETFSQFNVQDLTVNAGGTFTSTGTSASPQYINLYGTITNNGTFGSTTAYTGINTEGTSIAVGGSQPVYLARIRKNTTGTATTTLTVTGTMNMIYNGASIYNNTAATTMNLVVAATGRVINTDPASSIAIDGTDGTGGGERGGAITVNGYLDAGKILYVVNNNTGLTTPLNIGAAGTVVVDSAIVSQTAGAGSTVTIASGGKLQIRRHLTLQSGNLGTGLELLSQNGRTARIGALSYTPTIGSITMERRFPATAGWHFIGSPIKGTSFDAWSGLNARVTPKNSANLFYFTEGDTTRGSYNGSVTEIHGWKVVPATSQNVNGTEPNGYRVYAGASQMTRITGTPFVGPVTKALTYTSNGGWDGGGWNLIANPYPSEIDWNAVKSANTQPVLTNTIYIWNGTTGAYTTYSTTLGGTNGGTRYIGSSQGFFVKVTGATTLNFAETHKIATTANFLREGADENLIHMFLEDSLRSDESILAFRSDATAGFDGQYDGYKFTGMHLNVSTAPLPGLNLAANAMPELTAATVIPVRTSVTGPGTYRLRFTQVASLTPGTVLYLRDKHLSTLTDLSVNDRYTFAVTGDAATITNRFELVAGPAAVTSVANVKAKAGLALYPNPARSSFNVVAEGLSGHSATVQVLSPDGRVVLAKAAAVSADGTLTLPVEAGLAQGVYTVRVATAAQILTQKLVIE